MDADALSVARCTLKGSTFAFYVHMGSSFDDVVREIQSLFADVDLSGFILKYLVNGGAKCNLTTDRDVQMMLVSKRVARSDFIDIEVVDTSSNSVVTENEQISDLVIDDCDPISNTDHALLGDKGCEQIVSMTDVWKTYITKVKQVFYGGTKEFRQQLTKYTIALEFKIKFIKNDKKRVTAVCAKRVSNGCPWRIHGSIQKVNSNFYIKTFNNTHTCGGIVTTRRSAMVNSRLVALTITNMIRENPLYRPTDIMLDMKSRYGLDVSYWNAWYGRELARKELHGNEDESYEQLVVYLSSVLDTNPGSHCRIEFDKETNRFTRCFVAFGACIKGFQKCRPLLCLDGTHLKSKHKGTLLVATGKNGDQGLYPLAFAVVDNESDENWRWFMEHLHHILESDDRTITFIFDRNNGLINAIKEWFPEHPHAYCYHHLTVNIQSKFPGSTNKDTRDKVLTLFTTCAYTYSKKRFNKALEELKKEGGEVIKKFLRTLSFKNWANSYFPGERYGEMCSNIVESFNSMVLDERTLPITQLIDGIRSRLMRFIGDRSHDASKWTSVLCPKFEKLLNAHVKAGEHWIVNRSSAGVYEVLADYTCKVDLFARTCTCPKWRLLGFPCVHAVTVIKFLDVDPYNYVEDYFKVDTFRECYSNSILPIIQHVDDMPNDEDVPLLLPPKTKTQPGRPRSNRFKSTGEVGKIKCGRCGQLCGHNRRTCSENI